MNTQLIYDSANQRLTRNFTISQSKLLATFMVAQAKLETGNFKSNTFIKDNNAFGYKYYPKSIYQIGKGIKSSESNHYGKFKNVEDSAREVADWIGRRKEDFKNIKTSEHYAQSLKKHGYFGSSLESYIKNLKFYLKEAYTSITETVTEKKNEVINSADKTKEFLKKNKTKFIILIPILLILYILKQSKNVSKKRRK